MPEKINQIAGRIARQNHIDETFINPQWEKNVDIPLLELSFACNMPKVPVILMPELRFTSLLTKLLECLTTSGKIMIVDNTNNRFETLRKCAQNSPLNLFFSAQEVSALNYADNIFHFVLTEVGLATTCRAEVVFSAYRRVLKPGGYFVCSMPQVGSFPAFFDILDECLFKLYPNHREEIMSNLMQCLTPNACSEAITNSGLVVKGSDTVSFDLELPSVEQLLFASLVESHYLGYCLSINEPDLDPKVLLTQLVRAFHHYFQGIKVRVPMKICLYTAQKPE